VAPHHRFPDRPDPTLRHWLSGCLAALVVPLLLIGTLVLVTSLLTLVLTDAGYPD
jgi:hypothetical protein